MFVFRWKKSSSHYVLDFGGFDDEKEVVLQEGLEFWVKQVKFD